MQEGTLMKESRELTIAKKTARAAGKLVMRYYGKAKVEVKRDGSFVTAADKASEKFIKKEITKAFPDHSILGEETGITGDGSDYLWCVDPVDGTTNFKVQNPFFNVSIALTKNGKPLVGVVYFPVMDEIFYAEKGKGAFLNGKKIHVTSTNKIQDSFLLYCPGRNMLHNAKMLRFEMKVRDMNGHIRHFGAAALELCFTACGRGEAFLMPNVKPWDVAAGTLIITEAGGKVTTYQGKIFDINSGSLIASNGKVHSNILSIIKKIY